MNNISRNILLLIMIASLNLQARDSLSYINGFELKSCSAQKKCFSINAAEAESGSTTAMMMFYNFNAEIKKANTVKLFKGKSGYYAPESGKILLRLDTGKELEINLEDLSERYY